MQQLDVDIVASGSHWRLCRVAAGRQPLLGAIVETGGYAQIRIVESGGVVVVRPDAGALYGPGHCVELPTDARFLYLPVDCVEWVLHVNPAADPEELPEVEHASPKAAPVDLPLPEPAPAEGLYPTWATPWLGLPADVGTWASCLDIRSTSLTQRCRRLADVTPKKVLSGLRATVAFEIAAHYRGHGTELALDTGYSSHAHLSKDLSDRFGVSLTDLLSDEVTPQLDWLHLVHGALR